MGSSTGYHPSLKSILFFCFCWYVFKGFSHPSQCSSWLSCAPSPAESCPDHQAVYQRTLFLKGDSRFFLSSPPHLLDVPGSLPGKVARGRSVFCFCKKKKKQSFLLLKLGKFLSPWGSFSIKDGSEFRGEWSSPDCREETSEITYFPLAGVWLNKDAYLLQEAVPPFYSGAEQQVLCNGCKISMEKAAVNSRSSCVHQESLCLADCWWGHQFFWLHIFKQ